MQDILVFSAFLNLKLTQYSEHNKTDLIQEEKSKLMTADIAHSQADIT